MIQKKQETVNTMNYKGRDTMREGKLVRDNIPDIIRADGKTPVTRILDQEEYLNELDRKLQEEVAEYQAISLWKNWQIFWKCYPPSVRPEDIPEKICLKYEMRNEENEAG